MNNITKALQDLTKAVESSVKVTITLKKPKSSKAKTTPDNK